MRKRILIVDDDPVMARTVARVLSREFDVDTVDSGDKALEAMGRENFSGVVSDIDMPGMSATELYQNVVRLYPDMARHFVFFTANDGSVPLHNKVPVAVKGATNSSGLMRLVRSVT